MSEVLKLVPPPTTEQVIAKNVLDEAEHLVEMIKAGEIDGFCCIAFHASGGWSDHLPGNVDGLKVLGSLEAAKVLLMNRMTMVPVIR